MVTGAQARIQASHPSLLAEQLLNDVVICLSAVDSTFNFSLINVAFAQMLGRTPAELLGTSAFDLVHPDDLQSLAESAAQMEDAQSGVVSIPTSFRAKHASGQYLSMEIWLQTTDHSGSPYHMVFTHRSSEPELAIDRYLESTLKGEGLADSFTALAQSLECTFPCDVLVYWGWDGKRFAHVIGEQVGLIETELLRPDHDKDIVNIAESDLSAVPITALHCAAATGKGVEHVDFQLYPATLQEHAQLHGAFVCQVVPMQYEDERACMVLWNRQRPPAAGRRVIPGVGSRMLLQRHARLGTLALQRASEDQRSARLLRTDPLTQAMNRFGFMEVLKETEKLRHEALLFIIDVDQFKTINDQFGHFSGDTVLMELTQRFRQVLPSNAIVVRLGGDEFALLLDQHHSAPIIATDVVASLKASTRKPIDLGDEYVEVTISVGHALLQAGATARQALKDADVCMYTDKSGAQIPDVNTSVASPTQQRLRDFKG